ncbi:hypothetical protein ACOSQ2_013522 [Xanthoceras sorbifolium]
MLSLKLTRLLSCKPCPKIPKLDPFRQVELGFLWRNQAKNGCLIARSSVNISGGGDGGGSSFSLHPNTEKIQVGEPEPQNSQSNHENLGDPQIQLLSNQLKALQVELRKNNEEIKMLRETVQHSWKHLSTAVHAASSIQQCTIKESCKRFTVVSGSAKFQFEWVSLAITDCAIISLPTTTPTNVHCPRNVTAQYSITMSKQVK